MLWVWVRWEAIVTMVRPIARRAARAPTFFAKASSVPWASCGTPWLLIGAVLLQGSGPQDRPPRVRAEETSAPVLKLRGQLPHVRERLLHARQRIVLLDLVLEVDVAVELLLHQLAEDLGHRH